MRNNFLFFINFLSRCKKLVIRAYSRIMQRITLIKYGKEIKLSIGVGQSMGDVGWVSLDAAGKPDIKDSAELLLTIPDASCKAIVASAVFEHLNFSGHGFMRIQKAIKILKIWRTKLKKGGALYIAVPDGNFIAKGLFKYPKTYWRKDKFDYMGDLFGYMDTKYNVHSIFLNFDSMKYCLECAGFTKINKVKNLKAFIKKYNNSAFNKGILNVVAYA